MELKLLSCPLCLKPHFDGVDALRSSLIAVATSHLSCPVCNETFLGLDKLTIHLFSHVAATNGDDVQERSVAVENVVEVPVVVEEEVVEKSVCCDICNFCFSDETILDLHQKLLHQTTPDKKTGQYSYHCHLCRKKFKMRGSLMVHLRVAHYGFVHHEQETATLVKAPVDDGKECNNKEKKTSGKTQDNKQWECDTCSKMFTTKYFLKKHKRLHTGEMPYFCAQCNKSFTFQQSYHKHMLYHTSDKPHVCSECGRAFKELSTLHNHERIHSGERPFACETCGKCFRQRVSYLVHRRIHTGVMPYKCASCNKSFRYKVSLRSHKCTKTPEETITSNQESVGFNIRIADTVTQQDSFNVICSSMDGGYQIVAPNVEQLNAEYIERISSGNVDAMSNRESFKISNGDVINGSVGCDYKENGVGSDLFSMVLSPLMPNVESLCLNSEKEDSQGVFHTINEESLKELLYGPSKS